MTPCLFKYWIWNLNTWKIFLEENSSKKERKIISDEKQGRLLMPYFIYINSFCNFARLRSLGFLLLNSPKLTYDPLLFYEHLFLGYESLTSHYINLTQLIINHVCAKVHWVVALKQMYEIFLTASFFEEGPTRTTVKAFEVLSKAKTTTSWEHFYSRIN